MIGVQLISTCEVAQGGTCGSSCAAHPVARTIPGVAAERFFPTEVAQNRPDAHLVGLGHPVASNDDAAAEDVVRRRLGLPEQPVGDDWLPRILDAAGVLFALGMFTRNLPPCGPFLNLYTASASS